MKQILFAAAMLFALTAYSQNKSTGTVAQAATAGSMDTQTKQKNMEEVQAYLKECGTFFIATTDGDQPHVRAFGVSEIIDGRLYIMTGKVKDVYKQIAKNGKF